MRSTTRRVSVLALAILTVVCSAGAAAAGDSSFDPGASSEMCAAGFTGAAQDAVTMGRRTLRELYAPAVQAGYLPARSSAPERELGLSVGLTGVLVPGLFTSVGGSYVRNLSREVAIEGGAEVGGASGAPGALGYARVLIRTGNPYEPGRFGTLGVAYGTGGGGSMIDGRGYLIGGGVTGRVTSTAAMRLEINLITQPPSSRRTYGDASVRVAVSFLFGED